MLVGTALEIFIGGERLAVQIGQGRDRPPRPIQASSTTPRSASARALTWPPCCSWTSPAPRCSTCPTARCRSPMPTCSPAAPRSGSPPRAARCAAHQVRQGRGARRQRPERAPSCLPDTPTMLESGVNMKNESSWYGFFAPKGTPKPIIDKINRDLQTVIDKPDMREKELAFGYRFIGGPPEKLGEYLRSETAKWEALSKKGAFRTRRHRLRGAPGARPPESAGCSDSRPLARAPNDRVATAPIPSSCRPPSPRRRRYWISAFAASGLLGDGGDAGRVDGDLLQRRPAACRSPRRRDWSSAPTPAETRSRRRRSRSASRPRPF